MRRCATDTTPLKYSEIQQAIQAIFTVLSQHNLEGCLIGSAAAMVWGMEYRVPKDVDLLVLNSVPDQTDEDIKRWVVDSDDRFFLVDSRVPGATHRVLWYSLSVGGDHPARSRTAAAAGRKGGMGNRKAAVNNRFHGRAFDHDSNHSSAKTRLKRKVSSISTPTSTSSSTSSLPPPPPPSLPTRACKIDILIPGSLGIPRIPKSQTHNPSLSFLSYSSTTTTPIPTPIPVVPFPLLLLLKLRAWSDHTALTAPEKLRDRIPQDEEDIDELLNLSLKLGVCGVITVGGDGTSGDLPGGGSENWRLGGFESWREVRTSVARYVKKWPRSAVGWRDVGF